MHAAGTGGENPHPKHIISGDSRPLEQLVVISVRHELEKSRLAGEEAMLGDEPAVESKHSCGCPVPASFV